MFYLKSPREPKYAFYCIKKTETLGKFAVGLIQEACVAFLAFIFLREFSIAGIFIQL